MKKINRRKMDDSGGHSVWRSYSDMMSGLLLLFVLIMAVCLMQAQKNYTEKLAEQAKQLQTLSQLEASQSQLMLSQSQLEASQTQVDEQQAILDEQESELALQEATLAEQASALEELQKALEEQKLSLATKESEVEAKDTLLMEQESELNQQAEALATSQANLALSQAKLDEANDLMATQQQRIDQIIGVKAELIETLNREFQKNQINVMIDMETGAILLESNVLFAFNESELTEEGMAYLDQVLPIYCQVLLSPDYTDYVGEVIIDGYADSIGDYISNLSLSQQRAFAVAAYLYVSMETFLTEEESNVLLQKMTANGKSNTRPIFTQDGEEDPDASRRVEIKFRLKDEEMLSELQQLIEESQADAEAAAAGNPEADGDAAADEEEAAADEGGAAADDEIITFEGEAAEGD